MVSTTTRRLGAAITAGCLVGIAAGLPVRVLAHDAATTGPDGIVSSDDVMRPGSGDEAVNGVKVYLSSPRHADSGSRGECSNPGREENVNGRRWNWHAANGNGNVRQNFHERGYVTRVSKNVRDNGFNENIKNSRNFGADVHIITHTNALAGGGTGDYSLFLWENDSGAKDDRGLANALRKELAPVIPGDAVINQETGLAELERNAVFGDAYVELQFHDNCPRQAWIAQNTPDQAFNYGYAVDLYLDYPA